MSKLYKCPICYSEGKIEDRPEESYVVCGICKATYSKEGIDDFVEEYPEFAKKSNSPNINND